MEVVNTLDELSTIIFNLPDLYDPNKTEDVNVKVFKMISRIIELNSLVKHISWDCGLRFTVKIVI